MNLRLLYITAITIVCTASTVFSQKKSNVDSPKRVTGVAVSPSHLHLSMSQNQTKVYQITIRNDTSSPKSFGMNIYDFDMNGKGKSTFLPRGTGKYSLSKWVTLSPTFVELEPNEVRKVDVTVSIPGGASGAKAAWSILMVEQQAARERLDPQNKTDNTVALGIIPTFTFGVFLYQNPPNVALTNVEFTDFFFENKNISIVAENKGDGISYCTSYVEKKKIKTGTQERLTVKKFTILPGSLRDFKFELSKDLPKGDYLAVGVLDFENSEEIQAAQLELSID